MRYKKQNNNNNIKNIIQIYKIKDKIINKKIIIRNIIMCFVLIFCNKIDNIDNSYLIENKNYFQDFNINFLSMTYANDVKYDVRTNINTKNNNIILTGEYPVIINLSDKTFQQEVNIKINQIIENISLMYAQNQKSIKITYESIIHENYLSIMMYFENTITGEIEIKSINIDTLKNEFVDINKFLGINGYGYANKIVSNEATLQGISYKKVEEETGFYIYDGNINIVFGAGELTFVQKGNIIIELETDDIINYEISDFYAKSNYNVNMVQLRDTLEFFGYTAQWVSATAPINVVKDNVTISSFVIGSNKYAIDDKFIKELEFPPELIAGVTYVPISFFSEILGMLINTDTAGNIVISRYNL